MRRTHLKPLHKIDKKARILNAAITVFAHQGFDNSTISQIAEQAGVANGTVYLYYDNKTDLFVSAMKEITQIKLTEVKEQIKDIIQPRDKLLRFVEIHQELFAQNFEVARFILVEMRKSELFQQQNPDYDPYKGYLDFITELCEKCILAGDMRQINSRTVAMMILGLMDFILMQWICKQEDLDINQVMADIISVFKQGILLQETA